MINIRPLNSRHGLGELIGLGVFLLILFGRPLLAEEPAPTPMPSGEHDPRMASFDRQISAFMQRHDVPGFSLAVTDQGRLVYARGYGYANLETRQPVTPASLFRVASLSKPITAIAILQLVEQNKLSLQDKVFSILDYKAEIASLSEFDQRLRQVTIEQLLQHRGGWDRNASFDPMFQSVRFARELQVPPPAETDQIIRAMLRRKLDFAPGEKYAYSNFGYCLLGRVIEQVSGQAYQAHVRREVLAPVGITDMRIGSSLPAKRLPREVHYYDPGQGSCVFDGRLGEQVNSAYGAWHLQALDAHGGWVASATDLARLAAALDHPKKCPLLSAESLETMYAAPTAARDQIGKPGGYYYSLGWSNRVIQAGKVNHWHTGSLPGATATMIRRSDGRNFIALLNTRYTEQEESIATGLDRLLHAAAKEVREWPEYDRFKKQ